MTLRPLLAAAALASLAPHVPAQAPCLEATPSGSSGIPGFVNDFQPWDDGTGEALYVAGFFQQAGDIITSNVVRWDGTAFTEVGGGIAGFSASALEPWDDGTGEALFVGGIFRTIDGAPGNYIAKWDGATWSGVGGGIDGFSVNSIEDMLVYDDGSGEKLYVAGAFLTAGGASHPHLVRWDGTSWSSVGSPNFDTSVNALIVHDDGSGTALYAAGRFTSPASGIARWDGTSWSSVGTGIPISISSEVHDLHVHDDGTGPALYAAGTFTVAGGTPVDRVAKWDGASWSAVGSGHGIVHVAHLETFDDGSGTALWAAGGIVGTAVSKEFATWDGASWTNVEQFDQGLSKLQIWDDGLGGGPALYVGGFYSFVDDERVDSIGRWTGSTVAPLVVGSGATGAADVMNALGTHDDGGGTKLYADRGRAIVGDHEGVEAWDGSSWSAAGVPSDGDVRALVSYDDGAGAALFAAGTFTEIGGVPAGSIAEWDGSAWSEVGGGVSGDVFDLEVHDFGSGPVLVVAGNMTAAGGVASSAVVTWDGSVWTSLGSSLDLRVLQLETYAGSLYAGGRFTVIDGVLVNRVARWTGTAWAPVSSGMNDRVLALETFDDGTGSALYAGGLFVTAGGTAAQHIARWDGSAWSPVGTGFDDNVRSLEAFDDGTGPALIAGGPFNNAGPEPARRMARWDGSSWTEMVDAVNWGKPFAMLSHDDGSPTGATLFAVGDFEVAGDVPAYRIARYTNACPCPPVPYCTAQTNSLGCVPTIFATGSTALSSNSLRVKASNVLNNKNGLMFWGREPKGTPFLGGFLCVKAPTKRTPVQDSGGNPPPNDCSGFFSFHFNQGYATSQGLGAGDVVYCQYWSRDPQSSSTTNLTDALEILLCP